MNCEAFKYFTVPLNYRKPCMGKFSSVQDVLNGFLLDGTLDDYKKGELPLAHQHLINIENIISPSDSNIPL